MSSVADTSKIKLLTGIIFWLIASWILIHIMAVFGLFLAIAYPIWWFFAPKFTVCLACQTRSEGEYCPFCRRKRIENEGSRPKTFGSVALNSMLIILITAISFSIVFAESKVLHMMGFPPTPKSVSFVIPPKGQYKLGEIFTMNIEIAGVGTPINAVQADIGFDPEKVQIVNVATNESFANIFIQKEINNEAGYMRLTGGLPNPGYFSDRGTFGTVYFKGINPGVVEIEYLPTSLVLANDSRGTNVLKDLASVSYLILPDRITDEEDKLQQQLDLSLSRPDSRADTTKLTFYNEENVLGTATFDDSLPETTHYEGNTGLRMLEQLDSLIISMWMGVIGSSL